MKNIIEIYFDMFYNTYNIIKMGEFVVSPILMLTADRSTEFTATVVISGILIVVGVLLLLIWIFQLFGKIVPIIEKRTKAMEDKFAAWKAERKAKRAAKKAAKKAAENGEQTASEPLVQTPPAEIMPDPAFKPRPVVEQGINGEIVAAITAAIVASEGQGAVIHSIKRKNVGGRNPWAQAANIDNTRPF